MYDMVKHQLRRHRYKIVMGVPIVVLLASSLSVVRAPEALMLVPESARYVAAGEQVALDVMVETDEPLNTVSGTLISPNPALRVVSVSTEHSIIDLWQTAPETSGQEVRFAGGIVAPGGFVGNALVMRVTVEAREPGRYTVGLTDAALYAHDGAGTLLSTRTVPVTLVVREATRPTPDVNGDKAVNIFDFGIVSTRIFRAYEERYDLNHDGKITLADVAIIINTMTDESRLGSFASLFRTQG